MPASKISTETPITTYYVRKTGKLYIFFKFGKVGLMCFTFF